MNTRKVLTAVLLTFVALSVAYGVWDSNRNDQSQSAAQEKVKIAGSHLTAYYFHTTGRCQTCLKMESFARQAIESRYADDLKSGLLLWQVVNVEEPQNRHFIQDFALNTKSIVLVETVNGVQKRWKNLDRIWDEIADPDSYMRYVQSEIAVFKSGT